MAEWLGRGLQSLVQRFESARRLFAAPVYGDGRIVGAAGTVTVGADTVGVTGTPGGATAGTAAVTCSAALVTCSVTADGLGTLTTGSVEAAA